jgi:hypothetical protein
MSSHYEKGMGLKKSRIIYLVGSPTLSYFFLICPECKPFFLALDPDRLERIRQSQGFGIQHAMTRM